MNNDFGSLRSSKIGFSAFIKPNQRLSSFISGKILIFKKLSKRYRIF